MGLPILTTLNSVQAPGLEPTKIGRVVVAGTGLYTVPAGKVAKVTAITGNVDALGADATYAVSILRGGNNRPVGAHVGINGISVFVGTMLLEAGDIITNVGDAGSTNGTIDMTATVKEFDA